MSRLRLEFKPSAALAAGIAGAHAAAAAAILAALPGVAGVLLACALAALGAAAAWSRALLRSRSSVRAMEISGDGVTLELRGGERLPVSVAPRRYVTRFAVALPLLGPARRSLLVTPGMLEGDAFRRLRVWALWNQVPRPAGEAAVAGKQLPA